jgi:hypothetical protein
MPRVCLILSLNRVTVFTVGTFSSAEPRDLSYKQKIKVLFVFYLFLFLQKET